LGYEIYVDNKLYIKTEYISAVSGVYQFLSRDKALATANLVLAKMNEEKNLPDRSGSATNRNRYFKIVFHNKPIGSGFFPAIAQRGFCL